ncbi:hypothetical protein Oter_0964 [Opitutus terrae PB90-1]|uniref:Uncharacterized protein n=2 Tax=Opitutus terrae TaxID=107709 RepID=B1ZXN0_OPITP|nr:hypothetical protein Oter_0964 [Opitutus terrae PB90-1]
MSVYHVTYSVRLPPRTKAELHQMRDSAASSEVVAALTAKGQPFGTSIHWYPDLREPKGALDFLQPTDTLLMTTRPAVDDVQIKADDQRGIICNSNSALEHAVLFSVLPYFSHLSRISVNLSPLAAALLPLDSASFANIEFHRYRTAYVMKRYAPGSPPAAAITHKRIERLSATYFIHLPQIPEFRCRLIASWGMNGFDTLLWNRQVRRSFSEWLDRPTFAIALWQFPDQETNDEHKRAPVQPTTPMIADDIEPQFVVAAVLSPTLLKRAFKLSCELLRIVKQTGGQWANVGQAIAYLRPGLVKLMAA